MPRRDHIIAGIHDLPHQHECYRDLHVSLAPGETVEEGHIYTMTASLSGKIVELDVRRVVEVCRDPTLFGVTHVIIHGSKTYVQTPKKERKKKT